MAELKHEQCIISFELVNNEYVPKVCLEGKQVVLHGTGFLTLRTRESEVQAEITKVTGRDVIEFEGGFPGMPDLRIQGSVMPAGDFAPRFDWHIRIVNLGNDLECGFRVRFQVADSGIPRWMIPAMFYKHNRPANCVRRYPRYSPTENNPEEFVSSYWAFRSDRSSCPAVFCWTDNFTSCLSTPAAPFKYETSGLAFRGDDTGTFLMLDFPYVEEPVKYSFFREDGTAPEKTFTAILQNGRLEFAFSTYVDQRNLHAYDGLIRDLYEESEAETNPWLTKLDAEDLLAYGLHRWHYDPEHHVLDETCAFDKYFGKGERQVDRQHMHVAWVSGAPYAYALWRHGQEFGVEKYSEAGLSVLDKIADEGISPAGCSGPSGRSSRGGGRVGIQILSGSRLGR